MSKHTDVDKYLHINSDILIPGRGNPQRDASVAINVETGKIVWVGKQGETPAEYQTKSNTSVPVLMPGLWDCHVHFLGSHQMSLDAVYHVPQALAGARSARDAAAVLNAGYTSVRELGGYGIELSKAIEEGTLLGPRIYSAGSPLSQTGGHGDAHNTSLRNFKHACEHGLCLCVCDGVDECLRAVRTEIRRGAKLIKVFASGGVVSEIDNPIHQQFSDAELLAIVQEARRTDRVVAAHCHGKPGLLAALSAGCKTIEHGSFLDDEVIKEIRKHNAVLIATRTIVEAGLQSRPAFSETGYSKMVEIAATHAQAYQKAITAGVKIALGSDLGISSYGSHTSHGKNGGEVALAVAAGMTPLEAIEASTATAPETLGPLAPLSGQIKAGYDADIIALPSSPLEDTNILAVPTMITHIWKGGRMVKGPGLPVLIEPDVPVARA